MSIILVPTATAAFIADLTATDMQKIVDQEVVAEPWVERGSGRAFAPLTTAFAKFYFDTTTDLTREARRRYIRSMVDRVSSRRDAALVFSLQGNWADIDWTIERRGLYIRFGDYVSESARRSRLVARAEATVSVSYDVMGGQPVFRGTRVPIANVVASKRAGIDLDELQAAYPFLTPERIEDAETYQTIHPKVGRPRKEVAGEVTAERRKLISREIVALPLRRS